MIAVSILNMINFHYFLFSEITGSPHHGHAGKISIPVDTVPSVNVFPVSQPHRHESQSTCSPPPSEGILLGNCFIVLSIPKYVNNRFEK